MDGLRACVHCGICLPQCPTYRVLGEEMDSPRGRVYLMRAAAEDRLGLTETMARHLDLCLGCRACETACPSGVPFGQLLEATRGQLERRGVVAPQRASRLLDFILGVFPHPRRLGLMLHALRVYQGSGLQALVRRLGLLARFARLRALQASPEQRLEWLDAALEIARASGAWARERARRDAEMRRAWDLGAADRPR